MKNENKLIWDKFEEPIVRAAIITGFVALIGIIADASVKIYIHNNSESELVARG